MEQELISISEMAKSHHLTRQTLIYYDHIDLLKPVFINEHGYRYYSIYQIPFLREICLLKNLGIKLEDIKKNMENRNPDSVIQLLEKQKQGIDEQIRELNKIRMHVQQRINFYEDSHELHPLYTPIIKHFPSRKLLFIPFSSKPSKDILHLTLMKAWYILYDYGTVPSSGFGTLIRSAQFETANVYKDSGIFVILPNMDCEIPNTVVIPGGTFICMYKYSYPYNEKDLRFLINWIGDHDYKVTGDALDVCLLDTTFYTPEHNVDYCCLQIPIVKK